MSNFPRVGFIGLGAMGFLMAQHLISKGVEVIGYDVDVAQREKLPKSAASPALVAEQAEWIICMLPHPDVFREVVLGSEGIISSAKPGTMIIDMSTNGPEVDILCSEKLKPFGVELIDAPVGKGTWAAGKGELTILAGGEPEQVDRAKWVLSILGNKVLHCGPLGSGQVVKLANNTANCVNLASAFEAYNFAKRKGANTDILLEVMRETAADSWHLRNTVVKAVSEDFSLGFKAKLALKDLNLALANARESNIETPTADGAIQWYEKSVANGDGELDLGVIFRNANTYSVK